MSTMRDQMKTDTTEQMEDPEQNDHTCYYCGEKYYDERPPTERDDCGICDNTDDIRG